MNGKLIATLAVIACFSGLLIVGAYQLTLPRITANKARVLRLAVLEVLPGTAMIIPYTREGEKLVPVSETSTGKRYYVGYDAGDFVVGVAVEAQGQGFQETVKIIYGYDPKRQQIIGMKVLESKETPGLGDRIEKDPVFRSNFDALDVAVTDNQQALAHPIEMVKKGKKSEAWQIDTITGATISSKAIGRMLQASTAEEVVFLRGAFDER